MPADVTSSTDLPAAADTLSRAADLIEKQNWDGDGGETRWLAIGHEVVTEGGTIIAEANHGPLATRLAALDPYAMAALVPALRAAAFWAGQPTAPFSWTADLLEFARRLLREEET